MQCLLPSPCAVREQFQVSENDKLWIADSRNKVKLALSNNKNKPLIITGPCSIHNIDSAKEIVDVIADFDSKYGSHFTFVMRMHFEKPRTTVGWKGFILDPQMNYEYNTPSGIVESRKLLHYALTKKVMTSLEILDPNLFHYYSDIISIGCIGSRTVYSQIHRQIASHAEFPILMKNPPCGSVQAAIDSCTAVKHSHTFPLVSLDGTLSLVSSFGNKDVGYVLRGSDKGPNISYADITSNTQKYRDTPFVIDCSHKNASFGSPKETFLHALDMASKFTLCKGVMIESHLLEGQQELTTKSLSHLSVTDYCQSLASLDSWLYEYKLYNSK